MNADRTGPRRTHEPEGAGSDRGFTLVELLVAIVVLSVLMSAALATLLAAQRSAADSTAEHRVVEESRLALNRISRELRQAAVITRVVNPDGASYDPDAVTAITFQADFNGDRCINGSPLPGTTTPCQPNDPADPELLSYCHEPAAAAAGIPRLYIRAGALPPGALSSCSGGQPILAEQVGGFRIDYRSNAYRYDTAPADGVTSWTELDAAPPPTGNSNGTLDVELAALSSLVVHMTLGDGAGRDFRTAVALRNKV